MMHEPTPLTDDEKKAIAALNRVANNWPKSLWLFSASGTLCVMKKNEDGSRVYTNNGCVNSDFTVGRIAIENDGGDW